MERQHQPGDIIAERYRIINILGQGGIGITYEAEELKSSQRVALKAVSLRRTDDAKVLELFEREVRILAQLNHPAIPRYLDYFQVSKRRQCFFYLAQQLAEGQSLAVLIEKGWQPDELEVRCIANQLLEILVYLQQLTPPVLHRDIKPQNIIYCEDGRVFLVDFGAVQDVYHHTLTGGSTAVGTYGYMAPEQFRGQAVLATDLYALGATLISLLTQKDPSDLPHRKLKIDFRPHVSVTKPFADWLERMIEPVAEDRFLSASEALAVLRGKKEFTHSIASKPRRPTDNSIILMNDGKQLVVVIPPVWLRSAHSRIFALLPLAWNSILLLMIWAIIQSGILTLIRPQELTLSVFLLANGFGLLLLAVFGLIGLWILGTFLLRTA
jgi:serine/threonine protein kinase